MDEVKNGTCLESQSVMLPAIVLSDGTSTMGKGSIKWKQHRGQVGVSPVAKGQGIASLPASERAPLVKGGFETGEMRVLPE